ncbi:MAG TPA: DUF4837 family protein [Petrimonas sp.]|uniref:DUF4837 family protein n=1 Tax=Petrimonas sp. TaxID=2023866 RepID=UPI001760B539|nr:DUF4837 family protein [Petrimonas sp.]MEA4948596.1 DUF4837 family protein [Petrimonas sp.]MEA5045910.1 DUF4837 family protein [Petrimonas sp.]MEA5063703.1 DUF4837 family protein [Petrimonas sp.]HHV84768.1 DUF4837 family protein [Petrimonas sp.]
MRRIHLLLLPVLAILIFTSCNGGGFLSASSLSSEVLVIMDKDDWEGETGRALYDVLNSPAKGLPQFEPNFKVIQLTPENFTSTFKVARNIIIPEISNIYSVAKLSSELDKYASGQVIMTVRAPDTTAFINFLKENKEGIVNYILNKEMERTAQWLIKDSGTPQSHIKQVFGFNIYYPKGLSNISEHPNFFWATNNAGRSRKDIVIYQFPYTSASVFEKDSLIAIRNRVLGEYVTGSFDSHMTTATHAYNPDYRKMEYNGLFRAELRGLWEMTSDMMGGPFVSQAFVNQNTNMVVVVDVFVFAPEADKRNLMRSMEGALYTITVPKEKK